MCQEFVSRTSMKFGGEPRWLMVDGRTCKIPIVTVNGGYKHKTERTPVSASTSSGQLGDQRHQLGLLKDIPPSLASTHT